MINLASYQLGEQLHSGQLHDVFRGTGPDDQTVVLKLLKQLHPSPQQVARFRHEFETQASVTSEHVVPARAFETDQRRWALVQDDLGGESLAAHLKDPELGLAERLDIAIQVTAGLGDLHAQNIIHKDINPSNIVRNAATGRVKLIDFGLATALASESPAFSNRNRLEGTLRYISPEQTGRVTARVDYRSDLYSLGATFYELFSGRVPFDASDALELVHAHIAKQPRPLCDVAPGVPAVLGDLVGRLLAKGVDARYQSTFGLLADLRRCHEELADDGHIAPFELGEYDVSERFMIPSRLYGRAGAIQQLVGTLDEAASTDAAGAGSAAGVLVTGAAGMGKSSLVQALYEPLTARRGYYITGKFEQFRRTPFSAVVAAFSALVNDLLTESHGRLERLRNDLAAALGPNGRVVTDVIPQVELIIGEQPPVEELGASENLNRFDSVFRNFVRVFARPEHPVLLFLDDLQWADSASLSLMRGLMTDARQSLLILGAYRDTEVDANHPLTAMLQALADDGFELPTLGLEPLSEVHVAELVGDTTGCTSHDAAALASLVVRNTGGNPLFVTELLKTLSDDGLIRFDRSAGSWSWALDEIHAKGFTQSVLDLMVARLRRLDDATRAVLQTAACAGSTFDLRLVARLRGERVEQVWRHLRPAVQDGVLVATSELDALISDESSPDQRCSFFHDRVQQAAYELMAEEERTRTHLAIGRLLLAEADARESSDAVFEVVFQLNRGRTLVTAADERLRLAELNLEAGRRAAASAANDAAVGYFDVGIELLPDGAWQAHHALTMSLTRGAGEATYVLADEARSAVLIRECIEHARTDLEAADLYVVVVMQHTTAARYPEAIDAARTGLALVGFDLVADGYMDAMLASFGELQAALGGASAESFLERPQMTDPEAIAQCRLLSWTMAAAFYIDPLLYSVLTFEAMKRIVAHGNPCDALAIYAQYGHLLGAMFGDPPGGYAFTLLSREISDRYGSLKDKTQACFLCGNFALAWVQPFRNAKPILQEGVQAGLQSGDYRFAGYNLIYLTINDFLLGEPLEQVIADSAEHLAFCTKLGDRIAEDGIQAVRQVANDLAGHTVATGAFACDGIDDAAFTARLLTNQSMMIVCYHNTFKCAALTTYGDYAGALAASDAATALVATIPGNICVGRLAFHTGVCLAATLQDLDGEAREASSVRIAAILEQLAGHAVHCEANWGHTHALISAELARANGEAVAAIEGYETAIRLADAGGWHWDHALACELAGRYWQGAGRDELSRGYLSQARYGYEQWGAVRKLEALDAEFPELAPKLRASRTPLALPSTSVTSTESSSGALDLASVVKASQAISGEIKLDRLLGRLMELVLENAGAQHGVLVVVDAGELAVRAAASMQLDEGGEQTLLTDVALNVSVSSFAEVPATVVQYAARTEETIVLDDAIATGRFTQDPYVVRRKPRSVLCLPLRNKGEVVGLLYLENRSVTGAFTTDRLEILNLLASQFGISFENARLYDEMEAMVVRRTEQLAQKNAQLEQTLDDLQLTQDRLVHAEKMASLGTLTAGVAHELNNPLNFVNNFAAVGLELVEELVAWQRGDDEVADEEVPEIVADLAANITAIRDNGMRATGIVTSMLDHARGGGSGGVIEPTDLNVLVGRFVKLAEVTHRGAQLGTGSLEVDVELGAGVGMVPLVGQQFGRVVVNLLNNAVDAVNQHAADAPDDFRRRIAVRTRREGDRVVVIVEDNGGGVPEDLRSRIFEPFFTTKTGTSGTGLGLSLCYDIIVQGHNGTFELGDAEDGGARFTITLPGGDAP